MTPAPFVNRVREVEFLDGVLAGPRTELVLLYGRRRVGKTALLRHMAGRAKIPVLYHVAAQTTRAEELARLSARMAEFFNDDLLRIQPLRTWEAAWIYLGQKADKPFGLLFDTYVSRTVEPFIGALFRTRLRHLVPFEPAFAGRHWDNEREIDWVILDRSRSRAVAVEVKWTRTPEHAPRLAAELQAKVRAVPALAQCTTTHVLVSRSGFKDAAKAGQCIALSLKDEKC